MQLIYSLNSQLTCSHASLSLNPQIFFPRFILEDVKNAGIFFSSQQINNKLLTNVLTLYVWMLQSDS